MDKDNKTYELDYLLNPSIKDEEYNDFSDKIRDMIAKKSGMMVSNGEKKLMPLAYPIKKETSAVFGWIKFVSGPETIADLKNLLEKQDSVLRFLIIKPLKDKPLKALVIKSRKKKEEYPQATSPEKEPAPVAVSSSSAVKEKTEKENIQEEELDKKIEELLGVE
jgi:ribosomal protein S6